MRNGGRACVAVVGGKDRGAARRTFKLPVTADSTVIDLRRGVITLGIEDNPAACALGCDIVVANTGGSTGWLDMVAGAQRCTIVYSNSFACQTQVFNDADIRV